MGTFLLFALTGWCGNELFWHFPIPKPTKPVPEEPYPIGPLANAILGILIGLGGGYFFSKILPEANVAAAGLGAFACAVVISSLVSRFSRHTR